MCQPYQAHIIHDNIPKEEDPELSVDDAKDGKDKTCDQSIIE